MARCKSRLRGKGGNPSLRQGMVWNVECLAARIEQGAGRKNNKGPREDKKSQPKIWRPEYKIGLKSGPL